MFNSATVLWHSQNKLWKIFAPNCQLVVSHSKKHTNIQTQIQYLLYLLRLQNNCRSNLETKHTSALSLGKLYLTGHWKKNLVEDSKVVCISHANIVQRDVEVVAQSRAFSNIVKVRFPQVWPKTSILKSM